MGVAGRDIFHHPYAVMKVAFGDEHLLVSVSEDRAIRLWYTDVWRPHGDRFHPLATLIAGRDGWVAFTPNGRYKAAGEVSDFFWFAAGMTRFEAGELDGDTRAFTYPPVPVPLEEPFFDWPRRD